MILKKLNSLFNPDLYHGWGKSRNYFEGWYFKIVNHAEDRLYAVIPGVSMDSEGSMHSFIQLLDGVNLKSEYHSFKFEDFNSDHTKFSIKIGRNSFSKNSISLDLPGFMGELAFSDTVDWPSKWNSPGVMGPYSFVPFMECNHGIVSMDHALKGELIVNNKPVNFTGGRGYTEKDWGKSFPSAYIWMQSNHFSVDRVSMKMSIAKIPWMGGSFIGFISGLWFGDQIIEFTTYNKSRLRKLELSESEIVIVLENKKYSMEVRCKRSSATALSSPVSGTMSRHIHESMRSETEVVLFDREGNQLLLDVKGRNLALEVAGEVEQLFTR